MPVGRGRSCCSHSVPFPRSARTTPSSCSSIALYASTMDKAASTASSGGQVPMRIDGTAGFSRACRDRRLRAGLRSLRVGRRSLFRGPTIGASSWRINVAKNIVVCSDGTGNTALKGRGTNVFKLFEAIDLNGHRYRSPADSPDRVLRRRRGHGELQAAEDLRRRDGLRPGPQRAPALQGAVPRLRPTDDPDGQPDGLPLRLQPRRVHGAHAGRAHRRRGGFAATMRATTRGRRPPWKAPCARPTVPTSRRYRTALADGCSPRRRPELTSSVSRALLPCTARSDRFLGRLGHRRRRWPALLNSAT